MAKTQNAETQGMYTSQIASYIYKRYKPQGMKWKEAMKIASRLTFKYNAHEIKQETTKRKADYIAQVHYDNPDEYNYTHNDDNDEGWTISGGGGISGGSGISEEEEEAKRAIDGILSYAKTAADISKSADAKQNAKLVESLLETAVAEQGYLNVYNILKEKIGDEWEEWFEELADSIYDETYASGTGMNFSNDFNYVCEILGVKPSTIGSWTR